MSAAKLTIKPPANPGASSQAVLLDSTFGLLSTPTFASTVSGSLRRAFFAYKRAIITAYIDQAATFYCQAAPNGAVTGTTTWRTWNGGGSGEAITASTYFQRDVLLQADEQRVYIATATAPGTWEVSITLVDERTIAQ